MRGATVLCCWTLNKSKCRTFSEVHWSCQNYTLFNIEIKPSQGPLISFVRAFGCTLRSSSVTFLCSVAIIWPKCRISIIGRRMCVDSGILCFCSDSQVSDVNLLGLSVVHWLGWWPLHFFPVEDVICFGQVFADSQYSLQYAFCWRLICGWKPWKSQWYACYTCWSQG